MAATERDKMKLSREEIARRQGMEYALKIAKEKGIEGLEQEIKRRGRTVAQCLVPQKEMDEFTLKVKQNATGVVTVLSEMVLRDKLGFGTTRMNRFRDYINELADSIEKDYLTVDDVISTIRDETGIDLEFSRNDSDVIVKGGKNVQGHGMAGRNGKRVPRGGKRY